MIHDNNLPLLVIGYPASTVTKEVFAALTTYAGQDNVSPDAEIITAEDFLSMSDRTCYQFAVAFNRDQQLRRQVLETIQRENLNCPSAVHPTVFAADENFKSYIGRGSLIAPYCSLMVQCRIGDFCLVENYCLISHFVTLGNNVHMHPGTMIAGQTTIGDRCVFNLRSTVLNGITICDDVEIGACSTVTKDILQPGKYVGTPARRVGDSRQWS
jgi:UDP-3-O-[3-hydroxymyristoyl] glucosamine N-acyltransferase